MSTLVGAPDVVGPDGALAEEVLAAIGDDVLEGFGVEGALRRLVEDGFPGSAGVDELRRRLAELRRRVATGPAQRLMAQLAAELEAAIVLEREARAAAGDEFGEAALDLLPIDAVTRFEILHGFDWTSQLARARYEQVRLRVGREVVEMKYAVLASSVASASGTALEDFRALLDELNLMLSKPEYVDGQQFTALMRRHAQHLVDVPATIDELLVVVARRLASASRLLASLPPDQADQLGALMDSIFDDPDLQLELLELESRLRRLTPELPWDVGDLLSGGGELGTVPALLDQVERLGPLEELDRQLAGEGADQSLADVDLASLRAALGDDAVEAVERLGCARQSLLAAGAVRVERDELVLSPKGVRMIGRRVLRELQGSGGTRRRRQPRVGHVTRSEGPLDVVRSLQNATLRKAAAGGPLDGRLVLHLDDLEVVETRVPAATATVLLIDLSYSMQLQGHLVPAKRMALALQAQCEEHRPDDSLYLIGFSDVARPMAPQQLATAGFERVYGTNIQHGLRLARETLQRDPRRTKRVLLVTDGEPTAHMVDGEPRYAWPPERETVERTLREAARMARASIALDVVVLEDDAGLSAFAQRLVAVTRGSSRWVAGEDLGRHALDLLC